MEFLKNPHILDFFLIYSYNKVFFIDTRRVCCISVTAEPCIPPVSLCDVRFHNPHLIHSELPTVNFAGASMKE
jgi:hypothetical protein